MKRLLLQMSLLFLCLFLSTVISQAQVIWQGGYSQDWHDDGNWMPNGMPGPGDDVVIPDNSGTIYYYPQTTIEGLDIGANNYLIIEEEAILGIANNLAVGIRLREYAGLANYGLIDIAQIDADAIEVQLNGKFENHGRLQLKEIDEEGVEVRGGFTNHKRGEITLVEVRRRAFNVRSGTFVNEGMITCFPSSVGTGIAVIQGGSFENLRQGNILLDNDYRGGVTMSGNSNFVNAGYLGMGSIPLASAIQMNSATFENTADGEIDIHLSDSKNGVKLTSQSQFYNHGDLWITGISSSSSRGITVEGTSTFNNGVNGDIFTSRRNFGIYVSSSAPAAFVNEGRIKLWRSTGAGINSFGTFINRSQLDIYKSAGIQNKNTGVFVNEEGNITLNGGNNYVHIKNENELINLPCSEILLQGKIENLSSKFSNYGYMESTADGVSFTGSHSLDNEGIILDPYDRFLPILNNQTVRFTMLEDFVSGYFFVNALDLVNWGDYTIDFNWYIDEGLTNDVAFYDEFANEVIIYDVEGESATAFYVRLTHDPTGCETIVRVPVDPSLKRSTTEIPHQLTTDRNTATETTKATSLQVFPNPSTGAFNLQFSDFVAGDFIVQLTDTQGRLVWQTSSSDATQLSLDLTEQLIPGLYQVQIRQAGAIMDTKRLVIN